MKISIRTVATVSTIIVFVAVGLIYAANDRLSIATKEASGAREATLYSYRIAQSLKSLASGYELAMNEYYSTVLEYPAYQEKTTAHQAAIKRELAMLAKLGAGDANASAELYRAFNDMESFRIALEKSLSAVDKDWDGAREALFKLNVVSVRAIQQADILARVADERVVAMDQGWLEHQSQAQAVLQGSMAAALTAAMLFVFGAMRFGRASS